MIAVRYKYRARAIGAGRASEIDIAGVRAYVDADAEAVGDGPPKHPGAVRGDGEPSAGLQPADLGAGQAELGCQQTVGAQAGRHGNDQLDLQARQGRRQWFSAPIRTELLALFGSVH